MMMPTRRSFLVGSAAVLASPLLPSPAVARTLKSHDVTRIQVRKSDRKLDLIGSGRILKSYDVRLGVVPVGPKRVVSDKKTPEGTYRIDRRNPDSRFLLSLGISYPDATDIARARALGRSAGGDIFIHGQPNGRNTTIQRDWTQGCIAVSNQDMRELYALIGVGCKILIHA
jgi:murein L,D-transpeptidase YafK